MRRVLITGAAAGLGEALTRAFADAGDEVMTSDVHGDVDIVLDVTSPEDWLRAQDAVRERWGGLDVLVNNAGVAGAGRLDQSTLDEWRRITEINLFGVFQGMQAFIPMFKRQRAGHIVNIASLAGLVHPGGLAPYNAVKAAVVALSETASHELAHHGVRTTAVCPSYFRSGLGESIQGRDGTVGRVMKALIDRSPVHADDIAFAVLAALARGEDGLLLPDEAARAAYQLKSANRAAYDEQMRRQAEKLDALPEPDVGSLGNEDEGRE